MRCVAMIGAFVALFVAISMTKADLVSISSDGSQYNEGSIVSYGLDHELSLTKFGQANVLTSRIIRMEYVADESEGFTDKATFAIINRALPCLEYTHTVTDNSLTITTEHIHLVYNAGEDTGVLSDKNLKATLTLDNGQKVEWVPGKPDPDRLFGTIRTLDRVSGAFSLDCDSLHIRSRHPHSPVAQHCHYGLVSKSGWTVIDDSTRPLFDGDEEWEWVEQHPISSVRQDLYLLAHGRDYKRALYEFTLLSGPQAIPPKFSFGVFYSKWWPWADWEAISIIKEYEEYSVPLDVMVTDMDWHMTCYREQDQGYVDLAGQPACWTGWTWDPKYFPDPKAFMDWCHTHGIKNTLNLHLASGVQPWEKQFPEMAESMGLDPNAEKVYVEWNVTDKRFSTNFHELVLKPMEDEGVDFWWLDWQQGEGWFKETFPGLNPTFYLNYVFFTQPKRWANGDRPIILHRWGGLGNHRYPVGFSGDVYPNWESLAYQPYMTRESANVLFGYWSHDIGGFMEPAADELYLRWIQYGVFSPIFRTHGTRLAENVKRMWYYKPEHFKAMRVAMQWRARLLPYLYTAARRAFDTGVSVCSPLYYEFPYLEDAYGFETQYMFGADIMVAPVVGPVTNATQLVEDMTVWVPPGEWIELMSGRVFVGPETVKRSFSLDEIPLYVRAGAVIVGKLMGLEEEKEKRGWLGRSEEEFAGLDIGVYLPRDVESESAGGTRLYEDAGGNIDYLQGHYSYLPITTQISQNRVSVTIAPREGAYEGMATARYYRISLHGAIPPKSVTVNGHALEYQPWVTFSPLRDVDTWSYDGFKMAVLVNLYDTRTDGNTQPVDIVVEFDGFRNEIRSKVEGLRGRLSRAQIVKHTLDRTYPETVPTDYDAVTMFAALGIKLSARPDKFVDELHQLGEKWQEAVTHAGKFKKGFRRNTSKNLEKMAVAMLEKV